MPSGSHPLCHVSYIPDAVERVAGAQNKPTSQPSYCFPGSYRVTREGISRRI